MPLRKGNDPGATGAPKQRSRVAAINAKCRECIYDPMSPGNWRQQVEACSSANCPLHSFRPISRPRTHAAAADATLPPAQGASCAGGLESGRFRVPIDHPSPPAAPPLELPGRRLPWQANQSRPKNEKTARPGWRVP
jgi:hypothetical protein